MTAPLRAALGPPLLPAERLTTVAGFGMRSRAAGYLFRPTSVEELREILDLAKRCGRQVVLRGAGRSYGDASLAPEAIIIDTRRMRRILAWDRAAGLFDGQAGVTIEDMWRTTIEDGFWPPVVSGTMSPTLGGALAMNIHGKNAFRAGNLGEHVVDMEVLFPNGELQVLRPGDSLFRAVIGSAGLLGIITRASLRMKRVRSGDVRVLPVSCRDWEQQFETFEAFAGEADYIVGWVDCFATGAAGGRGQVHVAWHTEEPYEAPPSLRPEHQDLPETILGVLPASLMWRVLRCVNHRPGMRAVNTVKHAVARTWGDRRPYLQSLAAFSFLLDYVPNWRAAYLPGGFIQYQSFVPAAHARRVFEAQVALQQEAKLEAFLGVLKRHRPDGSLLGHSVDGYSLALDFKVRARTWPRLEALCHRMTDLVLQAGGRFYFAKDSTLRPADVETYLGTEALAEYRRLKRVLDPDGLLTSALARRLRLDAVTPIVPGAPYPRGAAELPGRG